MSKSKVYNVAFYSLFVSLLCVQNVFGDDKGNVKIINKTNQELCVYIGNNGLSCGLMPNSEVNLVVPTKTYHQTKAFESDVVTITDTGTLRKDGSIIYRENLNICLQKQFLHTGQFVWEVYKGKEPSCSLSPTYETDIPKIPLN